MSWGMVAVAGVTAASSVAASRSADKQTKAAREASAEQLAFEREKYEDWQETYGDIQTNLSDYYQSLSPEYYAATGLEAFETERQASLQRLEESLAQRGIAGGAIETSLMAQEELGAAETRAQIRRDAPRMAAEDKGRFLQIGLGQSPGTSLSQALAERTSTAQTQAIAAEQTAGRAISSAVTTTGQALSDYMRRPAPAPAPVPDVGTQLPAVDYTGGTVA